MVVMEGWKTMIVSKPCMDLELWHGTSVNVII